MLRYLIIACLVGTAGTAAIAAAGKPPVQQLAQATPAPAPQPKQVAAPEWQLSAQERAEIRRQLQQFNRPRK